MVTDRLREGPARVETVILLRLLRAMPPAAREAYIGGRWQCRLR